MLQILETLWAPRVLSIARIVCFLTRKILKPDGGCCTRSDFRNGAFCEMAGRFGNVRSDADSGSASSRAVSEIAQWRFMPGAVTMQLMDDYSAEVQPKGNAAAA